ncbi:hypothetical protein [Actinokineospora xionganensis]|uniref:Uncharacterized protein n=1 Tax=Actinokineospora xionganensis TaxID=2684470 RepID=A0ABR7L0G5_9PSEU|nr:hypothetical protein [Actinokineospora xionganensis]MBC6446185.1 hypothetical protein [Actinokineospora xionganensis]
MPWTLLTEDHGHLLTSSPSNRRQPFDATFSLEATDATRPHKETLSAKGKAQTVVTRAGVRARLPGHPRLRRHQSGRLLQRGQPAGQRQGGGPRPEGDRHR